MNSGDDEKCFMGGVWVALRFQEVLSHARLAFGQRPVVHSNENRAPDQANLGQIDGPLSMSTISWVLKASLKKLLAPAKCS